MNKSAVAVLEVNMVILVMLFVVGISLFIHDPGVPIPAESSYQRIDYIPRCKVGCVMVPSSALLFFLLFKLRKKLLK